MTYVANLLVAINTVASAGGDGCRAQGRPSEPDGVRLGWSIGAATRVRFEMLRAAMMVSESLRGGQHKIRLANGKGRDRRVSRDSSVPNAKVRRDRRVRSRQGCGAADTAAQRSPRGLRHRVERWRA